MKGEVINYRFNLHDSEKNIEVSVELDSHLGSSSLYIKECKDVEDESTCLVY